MPKRTEWRWWEAADLGQPPIEAPVCFTEKEWAAYYEAERQAVWNARSVQKSIQKDMCEDCTLQYQHAQVKLGKCQPFYGTITPIHRLALIAAGEPDPVEKQRKSRATPWAELPILSGPSIRHSENGSGEGQATDDADDSLVLPE